MTAAIERLHSLGAIDAETDFDPEFFVPSSSWQAVRSRRNPIVIGRKGTGKTAIRLALVDEASRSHDVFAADLAFRDYPWTVHNSVFAADVGGKSRYVETWLFLMLIELAKAAVGENQTIPAEPDARQTYDAIRNFVVTNWGSVTFDHKDVFRATEYSVTKRIGAGVRGVGAGVEWTKVERSRLGDALSNMNRWLKDALSEVLSQDHEYFIVFDELDLDFTLNDPDYDDSMIGLILAARDFFNWASTVAVHAMPVVLLRDDIYRELQFGDKNKISNSILEEIKWESDPGSENSLKTVVERRIRVLLNEPDANEPWGLVFDGELMRGTTQQKYLHMVQRTYLRPRDLIQFGNLCLDEARRRFRADTSSSGLITNADVTAGAAVPTRTTSELSFPTRFIPTTQNGRSGLRSSAVSASRRSLAATSKRNVLGPSDSTAGASAEEILEGLFAFSIIGFGQRGGGSGVGGTVEHWRYRNPEVAFDSKAPYFKIHPGLKENLGLKERR